MKVVLNKCYGGFGLSDIACEMLGCDRYDYNDDELRTSKELISIVESLGEKVNTKYSELTVIEIADSYTDMCINDYDGYETLIYVVDGKLQFA